MAGSSFWLGEHDLDTISAEPEFAVADSILGLGYRQLAERSSRLLEVIKLLGSNYLSGRHASRISAAGLSAFPRLADTQASNYELGLERASTGIEALEKCSPFGWTLDDSVTMMYRSPVDLSSMSGSTSCLMPSTGLEPSAF